MNENTLTKTKVKTEIEVEVEFDTESQVIVHCHYKNNSISEMLIRIWASTFLIDHHSEHKSKLVHCEKITVYPTWSRVPPQKSSNFSLIFEGLPKSCKSFDLQEIIPQKGGFEVRNIKRNKMDVYHVNV